MELQAKAGMPIRSPSMCGCAPTILCTCFHQHHADAILIFDGKQPMLSAFTCVHFYLLPLLRVLYSMCGLWHVRSRKSWAKSHCGTWTPPTAEAAKTAPAKRHTDASATACSYPSAGEGTGGVYLLPSATQPPAPPPVHTQALGREPAGFIGNTVSLGETLQC